MAEVRCPNCGRNNPDLLDVCQFCQTPLKPESVLRIGQTPTKKNTGELEGVLPDWLKDVRQQARDSAEEASQTADRSKAAKDEPPDLLAGLASQTGSGDDEEIPDWLASINPGAKKGATAAPASTRAEETDFFSQFNKDSSQPAGEPPQEEIPPWMNKPAEQVPASQEKDELSEWFTQAADQPEEIVELDPDAHPGDAGWGTGVVARPPSRQEPEPEEDLSWLHNLEETAKQTGDLKTPRRDTEWMASFETPSTPSKAPGSQDDLSWLDSLGGIEEPSTSPSEPVRDQKDDLSWLDQFGGVQASQPTESAEEKRPQEDLSWLNNLGAASEPSQPMDAAPDSSFPKDDLSWLNDLGVPAESSGPAEHVPSSTPEDLSWLKDIGEDAEPSSASPFVEEPAQGSLRRQTAPLVGREEQPAPEPDWLKSATEAPSMPPPGDFSMDWFKQEEQPAEEKSLPPTPQPAPFEDLFAAPAEPAPALSNQDVDSLFSLEMPDWLSRPEPVEEGPVSQQVEPPAIQSEDALAPVDLPSWVQAMRPVEAVISDTTPRVEDQPEEKEGPLAGLRGVIPGAPIGSSIRPKPISLKLQATQEQQSSAALLEQILGSETSPRTLVTSPVIASQQVLRWVIAGLFLLVLSAVIILRSQSMPVSPSLPAEGSALSNAVMNIPAGSNVLVVIDYEPALAGEMEAIGSPLLNQMVLLGQPNLSFISTSPNGPALVERLLTSARINTPDGFGYQAGTQYRNLGFLPGGSASVLGFMERPGQILPASGVGAFADYAAVIVMTDHAESGRIWVEQLESRKQVDPLLSGQPLLMVASAQAGPLLQPYVSSRQVSGMVSGLAEAARYESLNNNQPGTVRSYWDAFGTGLAMAVGLILIGSVWSLLTGMRARRAEAPQG